NYIFFFASVLALMYGWSSFKNWKRPPQQIIRPLDDLPKFPPPLAAAKVCAAATGLGLADMIDVATQFRLGRFPDVPAAPAWPYQNSPRKEQDAAIARMATSLILPNGPADAARLVAACQLDQRMIVQHAE